MLCQTCKLAGSASEAIFPIGSVKPDFYVLGDMAVQDEIQNKQVFITSTQANQYLMNTLNSLDMNLDNTRMFKVVRCCPQNYNEEDSAQYRQDCSEYSQIDIFKTKPKIIITLGAEVTRVLLKDKFRTISSSRGRLYDIEIRGEMFKVMPTYSPNYVINNPSASDQFIKDIMHARSYVQGDLVDISAKDLKWATTYDEFRSYYDERLVASKMPAYDLETNAYDPRSNMARMVGFSLAPDTTTGIYIVRNSLEYKMPEEDWEKIVVLTKEYLMSRTSLVHNIMYEGPFTLNEWDINILDRFEDTLIKARMLRGGDLGGAGLKDQCILNLGYPDWDTDLDNYKSAFTNLLKLLKPTGASRKIKWEYEFIRVRGLCALIDEVASYDSADYYSGTDKYGKPKLSRLGKFNYYLNLCRDTLLKYYETDADYSIIMELVGEELCSLVDIDFDGPFSYGFIPMKLIRKYGAMDAVGTQDLNVYLESQMDKLSKELDIDLHKGYHYLKTQFIAGAQMELNGLYWNDELAHKAEEWYLEMCYKSLLYLIDTPYLDNFLFEKKKWMFNDFVVENQMDYVRQVLGDFTIKRSMIVLSDGTKVKMSEIVAKMSEKLGYDLYQANRDLVLKIIRDNAHKCEDMWGLKEFYNPNSTIKSHKEMVSNILVTNDIKIAHLMNRLNVMLDDPDFNYYKYPPGDRELFRVLDECRKYNKAVEEFNAKLDSDEYDDEILEEMNEFADYESVDEDDEDYEGGDNKPRRRIKLSDRDTFDKFVKTLQSVQVQSYQIQQLVGESLNYCLESLSEDWIIDIHKYYLITGINLDDESTWNDEFKYLFNFRIFKKCNKLRTTYIVGKKVGRGQVWMVNKDDLQSGELLTRRRRKYDGTIGENEACIMQGTYAVCSAETLRWRTGMHTIPAGSDIKKFYTSRYKGGVIFAPDFSQMEIRVMSGAANCTPMIEAFKQGADIHLMNAAKIFQKPPEEILPAERRYSKMASFQILYGGDYHSFANEYLDGNEKLAKEIFDSFYSAFPEVRTWIEARHKQMKEKGLVTTPMDYFIRISPEKFHGDENKALRAAQNYPIQSAGSSMAGNVVYELIKYFNDNWMKSKIELFVHDSIEVDTPPEEFLRVALQIVPLMNKYPMEEFGIPTKADLVVGPSIGQEIELSEIEVNEDFTEGTMICDGYEEDFDQMIDGFKDVYEICEWEDLEEPKPVKVSWKELFIPKKCINKLYGQYHNKIKRKLHVKYSQEMVEDLKNRELLRVSQNS